MWISNYTLIVIKINLTGSSCGGLSVIILYKKLSVQTFHTTPQLTRRADQLLSFITTSSPCIATPALPQPQIYYRYITCLKSVCHEAWSYLILITMCQPTPIIHWAIKQYKDINITYDLNFYMINKCYTNLLLLNIFLYILFFYIKRLMKQPHHPRLITHRS